MKYIFSLLFLFGCYTTFAQNPIDGNWKGTRETPNGTLKSITLLKLKET